MVARIEPSGLSRTSALRVSIFASGRDRHSQKRAGFSRDDQREASLLINRQVPDRRYVVRRVEDQKPPERRMIDNSERLRLVTDFYRDDAVIELMRRGPLPPYVIWIARIDADKVGLDADRFQHRAHQIRFVFAVAVGFSEDLGCRMRAIAAAAPSAYLNRDVVDG